MTTLDSKLDEKEHVIHGKATQAKGVVREKWGELTNDERQRLAGRKDQIVGRLEAEYGDTWMARPNNWVLIGTAVATVATLFVIFFLRRNTTD